MVKLSYRIELLGKRRHAHIRAKPITTYNVMGRLIVLPYFREKLCTCSTDNFWTTKWFINFEYDSTTLVA